MERFGAELWEENQDSVTVRFIVSFMSDKDDVQYLLDYIEKH